MSAVIGLTPISAPDCWKMIGDSLTVEEGSTLSPLYRAVHFKFTLDSRGVINFITNIRSPPTNMTDMTALVVSMFRQESPLTEIHQLLQHPPLHHRETPQIQGLKTSVLWSEAGLQRQGGWVGRGPNETALLISFTVPLNMSDHDKVKLGHIFDGFYSPHPIPTST